MKKAPMVASSWLSWMSTFIIWTGVLSVGVFELKSVKRWDILKNSVQDTMYRWIYH